MPKSHFPYGNDLRTPWAWLGHSNTKSRYWLATYIGGWPLGAIFNGHTIALFGTESLSAAIATIYTFGVQATVGPGKLVDWATGDAPPKPVQGKASEKSELSSDLTGRADLTKSIDEVNSAVDIFNICMKNGTIITCEEPMSIDDLAGAGGAIGGVEIQLVGAASVYHITAERGATVYFGDQQVYSLGSGFLSAGFATAVGVWSVRANYSGSVLDDPNGNLPLEVEREGGLIELKKSEAKRTILDEMGAMKDISLSDRPFYRYFSSPSYIRELPGAFSAVPHEVIRLGERYAEEQKIRWQ